MPITAKALVGTCLALGAAAGSLRAWMRKLDEEKRKDEDQ
jgi:transposase-like protein